MKLVKIRTQFGLPGRTPDGVRIGPALLRTSFLKYLSVPGSVSDYPTGGPVCLLGSLSSVRIGSLSLFGSVTQWFGLFGWLGSHGSGSLRGSHGSVRIGSGWFDVRAVRSCFGPVRQFAAFLCKGSTGPTWAL